MAGRFEQFLRERRYLQGVSERTAQWYAESFKWLGTETPTEDELKAFVIRMRDAGLKATSCNNRIRAVNSYLKWSGAPLHIPKLKEPSRVLPTFKPEDITTLASWRPRAFCERRLYVLLLTLADTGCRLSEALSLRWTDIDWDNLLLLVTGKGDKQRRVPFSYELRKHLFKWKHEHVLVFPTRRGTKLGRRVVLRDTKILCTELGIAIPARTLHSFRHTFAVNYLRRGGSVFHLQRVLGHSSLEMTRRYVNLDTNDLSSVHERISLLTHR
jgi:integrase/recombinase XerD